MINWYRQRINPPYSKKDLIPILVTVSLFIAIPLTVFSVQKSQDFSTKPSVFASENKIVEDQTLEILRLNSDLRKATTGEKKVILQKMESISANRAKRLSSIIKRNPREVLKVAYPQEVKDDLPKEVQNSVEDRVKVAGSLEVLQIDDFDNNKGEVKHFLKTKKKRYSLFSEKVFPNYPSGTKVEVSGVAVDEKIVLDSDFKKSSKVLAVSDTTGPQKNVVILVNFQNDTSQKFTPAAARGVMFTNSNSVDKYYQEASYNKVSHSGDVYGWYTLPINRTCSQLTILAEAVKASDADINFQNYDQIVIAHPGSCGWVGLAYIGKINVSTGDGVVNTRAAWIIDSYFNLQVVGHEIGHGFGARHANALECGTEAIGSNCSSVAYADPYDVMGNITSGHFNSYHKELFSWFDPSNIATVSSSGNYSVEPFETATAGVKVIKVPRDLNIQGDPITWLYLEYRQQTGFDSSLLGNVYDGALVHYAPKVIGTDVSHLIDTRPLTSTRTDGALTVGQTLSDSSAGVTMRTTNKTSTRLDVQVDFAAEPPCTRANPTVALTPAQVMAQPGSAEVFTVSVTNNDSLVCGSSSFSLSPTVPVGWVGSFSPTLVNINPGSSSQATFTVTSALSALDGFYTVTARATNQSDTGYLGSASATYVVSNDLQDPSVSITSPTQGQTVTGIFLVEATATDDVGVTRVEFFVDNILKSSDTTSPYNFSWNTAAISDGSHTLSAKAHDASGRVGVSNDVSITVLNQDNQDPTVSITNPAGGATVSGTVNVTANASDNVGVTRVEFFVDNVKKSTDTSSPYAYSWNTTSVSNGSHSLLVKAYDAANNSGTSGVVTVSVSNQGTPKPPTVDIKAGGSNGPITIVYNQKATLSWTSANTTSCTASGAWSGGKYTSGSQSTGRLTSSKTYTLTCTGVGGTKSDSVVVKVAKKGDLNKDGKINIFDLSILLSRWNKAGTAADINASGKVDIFDLSILLSRWGS